MMISTHLPTTQRKPDQSRQTLAEGQEQGPGEPHAGARHCLFHDWIVRRARNPREGPELLGQQGGLLRKSGQWSFTYRKKGIF